MFVSSAEVITIVEFVNFILRMTEEVVAEVKSSKFHSFIISDSDKKSTMKKC
jgi:hypothetical protein